MALPRPIAALCELVAVPTDEGHRDPGRLADELVRALRAAPGARSGGLRGEALELQALTGERLWEHLRAVMALRLWTQQLAGDRDAVALRDRVVEAGRERVDREQTWFRNLPAATAHPFRDELAGLAAQRSRERLAATQAARRPGAGDEARARAAETRRAHRLAVLAALTAGVPNRALEPMEMDRSGNALTRLRTLGDAELAGAVDLVADLAPPAQVAPPPDAPVGVRRPPRFQIALAGAAVAAVAVAGFVLVPAVKGPGRAATAVAQPCGPDGRRPLRPRTIEVGEAPTSVTAVGDAVWVAQRHGVSMIDPQREDKAFPTIRVTDEPPSPANGAFSIAAARGLLWVARRDGVLVSVDPSRRRVVGRPVRCGRDPAEVVAAAGYLWVNHSSGPYEGHVARIDPRTRELRRFEVGRGANTVLHAYGSLWVTNARDGSLERVSLPDGRKVASVLRLRDPQDAIAAGGYVWVTQYDALSVQRVDPDTNELVGAPVRVGPDPGGLAASPSTLWIPLYGNGSVTCVDLESGRGREVAARAGLSPTGGVFAFGRLWVANNGEDTVSVIDG